MRKIRHFRIRVPPLPFPHTFALPYLHTYTLCAHTLITSEIRHFCAAPAAAPSEVGRGYQALVLRPDLGRMRERLERLRGQEGGRSADPADGWGLARESCGSALSPSMSRPADQPRARFTLPRPKVKLPANTPHRCNLLRPLARLPEKIRARNARRWESGTGSRVDIGAWERVLMCRVAVENSW